MRVTVYSYITKIESLYIRNKSKDDEKPYENILDITTGQ